MGTDREGPGKSGGVMNDDDWRTDCVMGTGMRVRVMPDAVIGPYAVHRRLVHGFAQGPGWTVTHRAVGKSVWMTAEFVEAVRIAEFLSQGNVVPGTKEECLAWRASISVADLADLMERLASIAPKFKADA